MQSPRRNRVHLCPETGKPLKSKTKYRWLMWIFPIAGLVSLVWFLIRVIPKPSRATYPCQRMAFPLASGFVAWLAALVASTMAFRKAKFNLAQRRYLVALACIGVSVGAILFALSATSEKLVMAEHMSTKGLAIDEEDDGPGWKPSTKKRGPRRRLSKQKRRNKLKISKL